MHKHKDGRQVTVSTKITINAPRELVFEYLTNLKYYYLWNPQIQRISSKERLRLGSTFETESLVMGTKIKATNVVTGFVLPKAFGLENSLGVVAYQAKFRLNQRAHSTEVKLTTKLSTDSKVFVFTLPIMKKLALRELRTDLQALKIAVEDRLE